MPIQGVKVTVTLDDATKTAVANDLQQWSVTFPARKASTKPITLTVTSSHDHSRTVKNILFGDVWYLTGSTLLTSEWAYNQRDKEAESAKGDATCQGVLQKNQRQCLCHSQEAPLRDGGREISFPLVDG